MLRATRRLPYRAALLSLVLLATIVGLPTPLRAQSTSGHQALTTGTRVRVTIAGSGREVGRIVDVTTDSLRLDVGRRREPVTLSRAQMTRLEISAGRRPRKLKGAGIGLLSGAVLGAAAGYASYDGCEDFECVLEPVSRSGAAVEGAVIYGILGAGVGTIVGAVWKAERWSRYEPTLGVRPAPAGGVNVGLAVSF